MNYYENLKMNWKLNILLYLLSDLVILNIFTKYILGESIILPKNYLNINFKNLLRKFSIVIIVYIYIYIKSANIRIKKHNMNNLRLRK